MCSRPWGPTWKTASTSYTCLHSSSAPVSAGTRPPPSSSKIWSCCIACAALYHRALKCSRSGNKYITRSLVLGCMFFAILTVGCRSMGKDGAPTCDCRSLCRLSGCTVVDLVDRKGSTTLLRHGKQGVSSVIERTSDGVHCYIVEGVRGGLSCYIIERERENAANRYLVDRSTLLLESANTD